MKMLKEFRDFISKGNVLDLAVAVIIGAAFGKIVTSFVNDILMPPIGILMGGVDFKDLSVVLQDAVGEVPAVTLNYGMFIQNVIDFLIIALCVFLVVKVANNLSKKKEEAPAAPPAPTKDQELLSEIRDLLKERK
ncbi:MAG: large-conductance mechanosensitive channel [Bacteroidetes bacterium GWF2_43_63]|nr:MAG: large-conductance mechanosensitive channel [Bacteroidetes bacterium GWE2_42_42]OFY53558.1 MAG: large-conductance mechanosensitive channel [Bacteroidetes bacterium GWF2_43_63]HBG71111.1 large conductance mechanosensitive channel protein MscL [Bacteroidales bacterium]HCB63688.1 large conductance mechanosensitive channel protein MscL [Bacteroidales bacterium]HCY24437.1 large conductance mechanosensitive channel protein MscL [Bacteroidales bacterium]